MMLTKPSKSTIKEVNMKKSLVILLSAAVLLTVLSSCTKKQEIEKPADLPSKVTIGTQATTKPEAIAIAEGWLTELMGVEVEIIYFDAGRDVVTAITSGSIDIGNVGSPPASLAIANGVPCQVFYIQAVIGEADALIVRGNLGIQDAKGLTGHRIAATFSSTTHYSLMKYLEANNVNPSDVDIINMRTGDMLEAFLKGDIDGAYTWAPNSTEMINNGGVMLTNSREVADLGYATTDLMIVRTEFAEKYPDVVKAYVRTMDRAVALYRNDPKTAIAVMARFVGLTEEECVEQAEATIMLSVNEQMGMRWAGSSVLANSLRSTAQFLYEQGSISQEPSAEVFQQAVTNKYLDAWEGK